MNSITSNEFTVKDTFCFVKEIVELDSFLVMSSLYVDSLFTNIPLDETIDFCTNTISNQQDVIEDINNEEFRNFLSLARKESYFIFNEVLKTKGWSYNGFSPGSNFSKCLSLFENDLKNALLNLNQ